MRSRKYRPLLLVALLTASLSVPPPPATAQEPQRPIRVQVELVNLYATVRDNKKRILTDLTKNDFRVIEDGQEQKLSFFSRETTLPITLGLLIDTSVSQEGLLLAEQEAASQFLRRVMRKSDLAFVISFDLEVGLLGDLTQDVAMLERAVRSARINAPGPPRGVQGPLPQSGPKGTSFYDAVYLACREKLAGEVGRKALVILTDAQDYGSKVRLEEALEAAQRTDTVIYVILIADPRQYSFFGEGYRGEGVAKKYSEETGGRVISANNEKKLQEAFDLIAEELRSQYTLGYYPANTTRDGKFRKIKIETTRPGTKVLARKGYYAPKG